MKLGSSKPWKEVMGLMTGIPNMDTSALREYFSPLEKWLTQYNKNHGNHVGWTVKDYEKFCSAKLKSNVSRNQSNIMILSLSLWILVKMKTLVV